MNRRDFVRNLTLLSAGLSAPSFLVRSIKAAGLKAATAAQGKILVVCELAGGVDGLNTIVPFTNDFYFSRRPQLSIPESAVLKIDGQYGFHPSMSGLKGIWDDGQMAVIHGVGYPNPNRSHFKSKDIWQSAQPEGPMTDGWLAKYLDGADLPGTLDAIAVGGGVPRSLVSSEGASPAIRSIETFTLESDPVHPLDAPNRSAAFQSVLAQPQNRYGLQEFVSQTALDATLTSVELLEGSEAYQSDVVYPDAAFAQNLQTVAKIIAADLGVQVFYVSIGGFDTHAEQAPAGNNLNGTLSGLLQNVSDSLSAFWQDILAFGLQDQVLIMTFSEFGRRLSENASLGTDHGTANQMFLLGGGIQPGFHGTHPSLAPDQLDGVGDMVFTTDFRSVYATVLEGWLGADSVPILGGSFPLVDVFSA